MDNGTRFPRTVLVDFHRNLGVQLKFIYVFHPHANRKEESTKKVIFKGMKKNYLMPKEFGMNNYMKCFFYIMSSFTQLPRILPSPWYIGQTPCCMSKSTRPPGGILSSIQKKMRQEFGAKQREATRYNSKVV